jgi:hypothetical protein
MKYRIIIASILITAVPGSCFSQGAVTLADGQVNSSPPQISPTDPFGNDWPTGPGRELTGYICDTCHSLAIVKQQGLSQADWDDLLDWMTEEQGMAQLRTADRAIVLNYLSTHFGITR